MCSLRKSRLWKGRSVRIVRTLNIARRRQFEADESLKAVVEDRIILLELHGLESGYLAGEAPCYWKSVVRKKVRGCPEADNLRT